MPKPFKFEPPHLGSYNIRKRKEGSIRVIRHTHGGPPATRMRPLFA